MAKPRNRQGLVKNEKKKEVTKYYCKDCANITELRCQNLDGEYFMCRCKYKEFSNFLTDDACYDFVKRTTDLSNVKRVSDAERDGF